MQANADEVRKLLKAKIEKSGGLRKFFRAQNYKHLNIGEISFFVRGIREPIGISKRRELGLTISQNVPVCPQCGVAHVRVCKQPFEVRCKDEGVVRMLKVLQYLENKNLGSRQK